jgi:undecaprenyl-diphosphatase
MKQRTMTRSGALLLLAWLGLLAAGSLAGALVRDLHPALDVSLLRALETRPGTTSATAFRAIVPIGGAPVLDPVFLVVMAGLLIARRSREALFLALASPGAVVLMIAVKAIVARPRPAAAHLVAFSGWSWPSADAADSLALYGALAFLAVSFVRRSSLLRGAAVMLALVLSALVGAERVVLGVHYPSDVAGGWLLAAAWLALLWRLGFTPMRETARATRGPPR